MPLQNRVSPEGSLHEVPERGAWMGNRGILHREGVVVRSHTHKAWITCALSFKGVRRKLMSPNSYTELFFLDEATAYAAGHRPCAECRRADYRALSALWAQVHGAAKAPGIDRRLHGERRGPRPLAEAATLPDGAMMRGPMGPVLKWQGFHDWSFAGYSPRPALTGAVALLTPPAIVALMAAGLVPQVHASAG